MYIPQLRTTLLVYDLLKKAPLEEKQDWLLCFLHIFRWADANLIRQWLCLEEEPHRWLLLTVFEECIVRFKDTPTIHQAANVIANWLVDVISHDLHSRLEYFMIDFRKELHERNNLHYVEHISQLLLTLLKTIQYQNVKLSTLYTANALAPLLLPLDAQEFLLPVQTTLVSLFCFNLYFGLQFRAPDAVLSTIRRNGTRFVISDLWND